MVHEATQLRILGPGVAAQTTKTLFNAISKLFKAPVKTPTARQLTGQAFNLAKTGAIVTGGVVGANLAFQGVRELTRERTPGSQTAITDVTKPITDITKALNPVGDIIQKNPTAVLLLAGGIVLLLILK